MRRKPSTSLPIPPPLVVCLAMALSIYMFQSMVELKHVVNFPSLIDVLQTKHWCTDIKPHPPGRLQETLHTVTEANTGSVSFKMDENISILVFSKKFKISGRIPSEEQYNILMADDPDKAFDTYMNKLLSTLSLQVYPLEFTSWKVNLINGGFKMDRILNYMDYIDNILPDMQQEYNKIIMPYVRKSGRVAAIKLYPEANSKKSVHFDHSGSVQFFAFTSVIDLIITFMNFKTRISSF